MTNLSSILPIVNLILLMTIMNHSSSARTFGNQTPTTHPHHPNHNHPKITFLMQNVLNVTHPSQTPPTTEFTSQIPFSKPLGYFPPNKGIPLPQSNPAIPTVAGSSSETLNFPNIGISFPARATLQELEYGSVTEIDEQLFEGTSTIYGSMVAIGEAKGIFVASSEDGNNHMVAITVKFGKSEAKDGLKLFGVYKREKGESHIAVIGGTGKFDSANGYAVIKAFNGSSNEENRINNLLSFNVYLS